MEQEKKRESAEQKRLQAEREAIHREAKKKLAALKEAVAELTALQAVLDEVTAEAESAAAAEPDAAATESLAAAEAGAIAEPTTVAEPTAVAESGSESALTIEPGEPRQMTSRLARPASFLPPQKRSVDFWQIYGLLLALCLVAIGGGLGHLWRNLSAYEASMPGHVLDQYISPVIQGGLPKVFAHEAVLPAKYESSQAKDRFFRSLLDQGELKYSRSASQAKEGKELYLFKTDQETLAALTLEKINQGAFGYWQAADIELRLPVYGDLRLYVPEGAQVTVNENELDEADLMNHDVPYEELQGLPQDLLELPKQKEYLLAGLYNQPVIKATGSYGNELAVEWREIEGIKAAVVIPLAPDQELPAIEEMVWADVRIYSNYVSRDAAFGALARRLLRSAKIYKAMQTLDTIYYTDHASFAFSNEKIRQVRLYSQDCLAASVNYTYTILRANGKTDVFDTVGTFYYLKVNGQWLIADIALQEE